jgi:hypothetical protein
MLRLGMDSDVTPLDHDPPVQHHAASTTAVHESHCPVDALRHRPYCRRHASALSEQDIPQAMVSTA